YHARYHHPAACHPSEHRTLAGDPGARRGWGTRRATSPFSFWDRPRAKPKGLAYLETKQPQIPFGNDNKKGKDESKGNSKGKRRFPSGMTTRRAKTRAKATAKARAKATAKATADSLRE